MFELILTICSVSNATICKDVKIADGIPTHKACMADQMDMAAWAGDNPGWSIARWRCRDGSKPEQDA